MIIVIYQCLYVSFVQKHPLHEKNASNIKAALAKQVRKDCLVGIF